jgi:hypothetical protein
LFRLLLFAAFYAQPHLPFLVTPFLRGHRLGILLSILDSSDDFCLAVSFRSTTSLSPRTCLFTEGGMAVPGGDTNLPFAGLMSLIIVVAKV